MGASPPALVADLVDRFSRDREVFLPPDYKEEKPRADFLNSFFEPVGCDINGRATLVCSLAWLVVAASVVCSCGRSSAPRTSDTQMQQVQSSALRSTGYEEHTRLLTITFLDGSTYEYDDVPQDVYKGLVSASSQGSYFNTYIRGRYVYRLTSSEHSRVARRDPRALRPLRQHRPSRFIRSTRQRR